MTRPIRLLFLAAAAFGLTSTPALAWKQFMDQWIEVYITDTSSKEFAEHVTTEAKCYVCHQGKKKSNHNPYGIHLTERLTKDDRKDVDKIAAAIKEVGALHSVEDDETSPTYVELIEQGKLPGGTLEQAKEDPKVD